MSARRPAAHLRPVHTSAAAAALRPPNPHGDQVLICCYDAGHDGAHEHETAPALEPIARVEIQWGHRLPLDMPGRDRYRDADRVHRCHADDHRPDPGVPCEQTHTYQGDPLEHVWRKVITTEYQGGQP